MQQFKLYLVFVQFESHLSTENTFKANMQLKAHFRGSKHHMGIIYKTRLTWTLKKKKRQTHFPEVKSQGSSMTGRTFDSETEGY